MIFITHQITFGITKRPTSSRIILILIILNLMNSLLCEWNEFVVLKSGSTLYLSKNQNIIQDIEKIKRYYLFFLTR
jgi:hypothetical protein